MTDRGLNSNNGDNLENFIGAVLVGASLTLTGNSSLKTAALRTNGSKRFLFPIVNFSTLLNEFAMMSSTAVITGSIIPTYNAHCTSGNSIPPRNQGSTAHCDLNKKPSIIGGINTDQKNDIVNDDNKLNNDHNRKNSISTLWTTAPELIARERRNAKEKKADFLFRNSY
ncbi:11688_t:CDS:2 [Ambispora leptoticha]|uniref:11688_t:CDS:1 n=1 Tax=Ambispora leptoticha TaxID=144679 RepID=A0A9N9AS87_9GLOM|nr:11688_t:CDS:2 [Ambispora leptoticha]